MASNEIKVDFILKGINDAKKSLDGVNKEVSKISSSQKKLSSSFSGFGNSIKGIGNSFKGIASSVFSLSGAATAFIAAFSVKKLVDAANIQEDAINALNTALKISGNFTDEASQNFQDYASSLQQVSKFGDEAILQNAALIQSLAQLDNEGLKGATKGAIDLAAGLGIDLASASNLVGKALTGQTSVLTRYGIQVRKGSNDAETLTNVLDALNQKFGGAAAAQLNTFSGATQSATNAFGDLLEEVGFLITKNPALIKGVNQAKKIFEELGTQVKENRTEIIDFVIGGVIFLTSSIKTAIGGINLFIKAFYGIEAVIELLLSAILNIGKVFIRIIASIIKGAEEASTFIRNSFVKSIDFVTNIFRLLGETILKVYSKIIGGFAKVTSVFGDNAISDSLNDLKGSLDGFADGIKNSREQSEKLGSNVVQSSNTASNAVNKLADDIGLIAKASLDASDKTISDINGVDKAYSVVGDTIDNSLIKPLQGLRVAQRDQSDEALGAIRAQQKEQAKLSRAFVEQQKAIEKIPDTFKEIRSSPLEAVIDLTFPDAKKTLKDQFKDTSLEINQVEFTKIAGLASGLADGIKGGAKKFVGTLVSSAGAFLQGALGPLGGVIGQLFQQFFELFSQTPEKFREQILAVFKEIPQLLVNIIQNIINLPEIIDEGITAFIDQMPLVAEKLAEFVVSRLASPIFWQEISIKATAAFIRNIPEIIQGYIDGFRNGFDNIFKKFGQFFDGIKNAFKSIFGSFDGKIFEDLGKKIFNGFKSLIEKYNPINLLSKLFRFESKGKGPVERFIGLDFPFLNFFTGGKVEGRAKVSGDSPKNDTIMAFLSAGEGVIPRSAMDQGLSGVVDFAVNKLGMGMAFGGFVGDAFQAISDFVAPVTNTVSSAVDYAVSTVGDVVQEITDAVISVIPDKYADIIRALRDLGAEINPVKFIRQPQKTAKNAVKSLGDKLFGEGLRKLVTPPALAEGGKIPSGFANDTFPARLTSGELVVKQDTTKRLEEFLQSPRVDNSNTEILLAKVVNLLQKPITTNATVELNKREFANILVELSRTNTRVAI
jgi:phage-related protein